MDFGLTASTGRFLSEYQARHDTDGEAHFLGNITALFSIIGLLVLCAGIITYFFLPTIFPNFSYEQMSIYRVLYIMALCNTAFCFPLNATGGVLLSRTKFAVPGLAAACFSILNVIGTILLLFFGYKSIGLLALNIATGLAGLAFNVVYCYRFLHVKIKWNGWDFKLCKKVYLFSFWIFVSYITGILNWGTGNFILGITSRPEDISVFAIGLAIFSYYYTFSSGISRLFLPKVVRLITNNASSKEITMLMVKVGRFHVFILLLMLTGLLFFGQDFLTLWVGRTLGDRITESWWVTIIMSSALTIPLIQCLGGQILQAKNLVRDNARVQIIVSCLCLILGYILSTYYGTYGIAVGSAVAFLLGQVVYQNLLYSHKAGILVKLFFTETFRRFPVALLVPCLLILILSFFDIELNWMTLILKISIYSIIYCLAMFFLYLTKEERKSYAPFIYKR
jgi:O-antigen/teichoic acid export membrane protein